MHYYCTVIFIITKYETLLERVITILEQMFERFCAAADFGSLLNEFVNQMQF